MESKTITKKALPSDLSQLMVIARYEMLKYMRSKRIYGIAAIVALIFVAYLAIPLALGDPFPDESDDIIGFFANYVTLLIVIIASLFAGDAIVSEFQQRTGYLLFPNPVKRGVLYSGKFLGAMAMSALVLAIYYGGAAVISLALSGDVIAETGASFGLALLYMAAAISFGFLLSSAMKGSTAAIVLLFLTFTMVMNLVAVLLVVGNVDSTFVLTVAGTATYYILQDPYPVGDMIPEVVPAVATMLAYLVGCYAIGFLLFRRREMVS